MKIIIAVLASAMATIIIGIIVFIRVMNTDDYDYIGKYFLYISEYKEDKIIIPTYEDKNKKMIPCKVLNYYNKSGYVVVKQIMLREMSEYCRSFIEDVTGSRGMFNHLQPDIVYYWHLIDRNIVGSCMDELCSMKVQ
jgi:hypothetical protein